MLTQPNLKNFLTKLVSETKQNNSSSGGVGGGGVVIVVVAVAVAAVDLSLVIAIVMFQCSSLLCAEGWRIGKGQGLSDLEYAMMVSTGSVGSDVVVMTLVHDCQVIDLPDDLFGPHDVPVDYIVTPTMVICCADHESMAGDRHPKPAGIIWSLLGPNDLDRIPVLQRIRYREWKSGKDVRLSGEESCPTDLEDVILPEPHISNHGDHGKAAQPISAGQKPRRSARYLADSRDIEIDGDVDETKDVSTKVITNERKAVRYRLLLLSLVCVHCNQIWN